MNGDGAGQPLNVRTSNVLACAVMVRGKGIPISDVTANVAKLQAEFNMPKWNREGFKIGLCEVNGLHHKNSMLSLTNSDMINGVFETVRDRFNMLYRRKANLHHYTNFCEVGDFDDAINSLDDLISDYKTVGAHGRNKGDNDERLLWDLPNSHRKSVAF